MSTRETPREQSRRMFADAMTATTTNNLLALAIQYTNALVSSYATDPALTADTAADLAAVANEIERRAQQLAAETRTR